MVRRFIAVALLTFGLPSLVFAKTPNDPYFGEQLYAQRIHAPEAWDVTEGSPTIIVAVLDTGVDLTHPDLRANIWTNGGEVAGDGVDNDGNGFIDDMNGWDFVDNDNRPVPVAPDVYTEGALIHGTLIAGIVGAQGNNAEGVAGLAWHVRLMSVRMLDAEGNGLVDQAARALDYAVRNGARVVNMSFTGTATDPLLTDALARALDAGVVVVAAVGNKTNGGGNLNETPVYPACTVLLDGRDPIIGVAATDLEDRKASYSNFGTDCTDIAAPGSNMFGAQPIVPNVPTLTDTRYGGGWSGTSLASPVVAGAAALLLSEYSSLTPEQVRTIMELSADPIVGDVTGAGSVGIGRLNIARALSIAGQFVSSSSSPSSSQPSPQGGEGVLPTTSVFPTTARSPVTGKEEPVTQVATGGFIRSPSFSTVYYVTSDFTRRPFFDVATFRTYGTFAQVKTVTDATLPLMPLAAPMLPKPGTVLVKIQSDPRTFAVTEPGTDGKPVLRYIPSEAEAIRLCGASWAQYVIDLPPTLWNRFAFGQDVGPVELLPTAGLIPRSQLK